ncbi:DUF4037 domain-containing protein [Phytomonospora endophytica]|uniref:DUF4037 domain-containing protein n=1 Tax=Phytomonospora endophytica TaxID=714109 RepID=A0A841F9E0_9ACTN|nr:DUF4037 domain-containing protein [Phytomonospora endophytica]MBB6032364.1 hypothetical protein [Phytomonospora endophytica]GIG68712.1 hypothetical protein Pen01_50070 [Phytomonospora endophytica]
MSGRELSRRFHASVVSPLLNGIPHAAALLGEGSEVLGFDDDVSPDHDFGPRCQVYVAADDIPAARAALDGLPEEFEGLVVRYARTDGSAGHQVEVTTPRDFFTARLAVDPADGMSLADWLLTPTQRFATLADGPVFADPDGALAARQDALRWYPEDVWRYALAAAWLRVGQEEAFVGRTGGRGDELGSAILGARLTRELVRLAFLVERRWAPYAKWLGTAFRALPIAARLGPLLDETLHARDWRSREAALVRAGAVLAEATNALGLAEAVDPEPHRFHTRDIRVIGGERFTEALAPAITDPEVRALLERLGSRSDRPVGRLVGTIDQAADSSDVLANTDRFRAARAMLGLLPES